MVSHGCNGNRAACHAASLEASCRTESRWMTAAVRAEGARLPSKPSWNGTQLLFGGLQVASPARRSTALPRGIHGCLSPPMRCAALITCSLEVRHSEAQKMRRQVLSAAFAAIAFDIEIKVAIAGCLPVHGLWHSVPERLRFLGQCVDAP